MDRQFTDSDVATIKQRFEDALDALASGDMERWLGYWTDDVINMPPGQQKSVGKAALKEFWKAAHGRRYTLSDIQAEGCGDLAVIISGITIPDKSGGGSVTGNQMFKVRRNAAGTWQIAAAIVTFDSGSTI